MKRRSFLQFSAAAFSGILVGSAQAKLWPKPVDVILAGNKAHHRWLTLPAKIVNLELIHNWKPTLILGGGELLPYEPEKLEITAEATFEGGYVNTYTSERLVWSSSSFGGDEDYCSFDGKNIVMGYLRHNAFLTIYDVKRVWEDEV